MTKEYFFAYKAQTKAMMIAYLEHSHTVGYPLKPYCEAHSVENIQIKRQEEEEELRHYIDRVHELMQQPNTKMTMVGQTEQVGRYDIFSSITYSFDTIVVRHYIEDYQVEEVMKHYTRKQLKLTIHQHLECKVMQLFKDGFITWADVEEAHKLETCSL